MVLSCFCSINYKPQILFFSFFSSLISAWHPPTVPLSNVTTALRWSPSPREPGRGKGQTEGRMWPGRTGSSRQHCLLCGQFYLTCLPKAKWQGAAMAGGAGGCAASHSRDAAALSIPEVWDVPFLQSTSCRTVNADSSSMSREAGRKTEACPAVTHHRGSQGLGSCTPSAHSELSKHGQNHGKQGCSQGKSPPIVLLCCSTSFASASVLPELTLCFFTFCALVSPLREREHCCVLPQGAGGNAFSASVPSHFISFLVKEEMFYKEGGKTLEEVAQISLGWPIPEVFKGFDGEVLKGFAGWGFEQREKCPCPWH